MTQIQASVSVKDNVDSKIEQKIKAIGVASITTASQLATLQKSINSISASSVNNLSTSINTLSRTNLGNLRAQMQQLAQVSSQVGGSFSTTAIQAVRLQTAQVRLQQEQTKLAILNTRLQQTSIGVATAQARQHTATANLANAQSRATTATIRTQQAQTQAIISAIRLQQAQARLEAQMRRNAEAYRTADTGLRQFVGTMFALGAIGSTAMGIAKLGDEYQSMINKLSLVTENSEQARNRLASLTNVALSSYNSLESVTQLYTRLDMALKQVGGSASEAMQVTQTLSKTVSLAGLNTAEANSALLQISQAFNKGKLDGDEFRTVMETMPPLADAIARKLKVQRGELLKLAPQGKITAQVMKEAIIEMSETIDNKFANLTPTVAMQLQNLQQQAQVYFGAMFKDTGMAENMGKAIQWIANHLELATRLAYSFGLAVAIAMATKTVSSFITVVNGITTAWKGATGAVAVFNAVTKASPIGWIIAGVTALGFVLDSVFDGVIGKTFFPSYDQDTAKINDYISRLKDLNSQMNVMSFTKLTQESTLLDQALATNKETMKQSEEKIREFNESIREQEESIARTRKEIERFKGNVNFTDYVERALERVEEKERALIHTRAELTEETRNLESVTNDNIELLKTQLNLDEQLIAKIENARKAIEGKSKADIEANAELREQQRIVDESSGIYDGLIVKVRNLKTALLGLIGLNGSLKPAINAPAEEAVNKVRDSIVQKYEEEALWKEKYAKADKKEQLRMNVEKSMAKDKASFVDKEGTFDKALWDKTVDRQVKAEETLQARQEADAKAKQSAKKHANEQSKAQREAQREAKKHADEIQRAREEKEQFIVKLNDELALLKEGYDNYNKYNELYALRLKMQQKGISMSNEEMNTLKAKIDAVEREKELAKEINSIEDNSLQKQREKLQLQLKALEMAKVSDTDRTIAQDEMLNRMGATRGLDQGIPQLTEQYRLHYEAIDQMRISDQEKEIAKNVLLRQQNSDMYDQYINNMRAMGGMWEVLGNSIKTFEDSATNALTSVLMGTSSIADAMRNLATTILNEVVHSIVKMGVRWAMEQATMHAIGIANQESATASAVASGSAITSAMTPAATATAVATQGASVGAGMTALMGAFMAIPTLIALAGKRRNGGSVNAGSLYQVGEGNAPEIYQSRSGRQYMIAGDNGRVFSNKDVVGNGGRNVSIVQHVTINGDGKVDSNTLAKMREETRNVVYQVLTEERRDAGGMLA